MIKILILFLLPDAVDPYIKYEFHKIDLRKGNRHLFCLGQIFLLREKLNDVTKSLTEKISNLKYLKLSLFTYNFYLKLLLTPKKSVIRLDE